MKAFIRESLYGILFFLGVFKLFGFLNRHKPVILYYHGITAKKRHGGIENHQGKHLYIKKFIRQMRYLKRFYRVIPLPALCGEIKRNEVKPYTVAITFDDGYANNYSCAFPVLKSLSLPATVFLTTALIGKEDFLWVDEIEYLLNNTEEKKVTLNCNGEKRPFDLGNNLRKVLAEKNIRSFAKSLPDEDRLILMQELRRQCRVGRAKPDGDYSFLRWEDVREMHGQGINFGAHSRNHPVLTRLPVEMARDEILSSRDELDRYVKEEVRIFCYPGGFFNDDVRDMLKSAGFAYGLTTMPGYNDFNTDPYELRRFGASANGSFAAFAASISGFNLFLERGLSRIYGRAEAKP